jgi:hypothetical protein
MLFLLILQVLWIFNYYRIKFLKIILYVSDYFSSTILIVMILKQWVFDAFNN